MTNKLLHEETVSLGSDNVTALSFKLQSQDITHVSDAVDDTVVNQHSHPLITRCKLTIEKIIDDSTDADMIVDSQTEAALFSFADPEILKFTLGSKAIKPGRHICKIQIYDASSNNGMDFGKIMLTVE